MAVILKEIKKDPQIINRAKISEININVSRQECLLIIDYGYVSPVKQTLQIVERQSIILSKSEFLEASQIKTTGNLTIYDELSNILYNWLVTNKKLKYQIEQQTI